MREASAAPLQGPRPRPAEYPLSAKTAGVLSVAVQGTGDLALQLVDEDGQVLPDGTSDRDLGGNEGTELLSTTVTEPGSYRVRVRLQGDAQDRSDQDLQGNAANESVSVQVTSGQPVHVRVSDNFSRAAKYRLSSSLAP